jgi:hypothetical protein
MVMAYDIMLLNISFDELILHCIYIVQEKKGAIIEKKNLQEKKNLLGWLLIADLKCKILKSARRATSAL